MKSYGRKLWAIPGGHIPPESRGHEPQLTSYDKIHILNCGNRKAVVTLTIFYTDKDPVEPYAINVEPRRLKSVRFNDLIDPEALFLAVDYACLIESNVPVIVQFTRQDTGPLKAITTTMAYPVDCKNR